MAKNRAARKPSVPRAVGSGDSQGQLTKKIDRVDRDLMRLLGDRAKLVQRLGRIRDESDNSPVDLVGEQRLLDAISTANKGPLTDQHLRTIFREIVSGCRALVKPLRVAYLGPKYSYSYLATCERFGESAELAPVATVAAVFEELQRGHVNYGVVPLENSTDGRVVDTLGMFARIPVRICGEVQLRIHHSLMAKCARDEIQEVYSKPQALSQCRDWLAKHLPWARSVEITSTAAAAQLAVNKPGAAAVASRLAASSYGLNIVAENIEDNKNNITRFAVLGGEGAPRTGQDKTALMIEIAHRPGSLADVMAVFKRGRLNLTWIESCAILGRVGSEFFFFVELEGHQGDARVRKALNALQRRTVRMEILGSYAKSNPLD